MEGARHDDVRQTSSVQQLFFCHRDPSTTVPMSQRRTRRRRVYHLTSQEDVGAPLCMVRRQSGGAAGGLDGLQTLTSQSSMVPPLKGTILTRWQAEARSGVSPQQVKKTYDEKQFSNENPNSKGLKAFWKPSKLVLRSCPPRKDQIPPIHTAVKSIVSSCLGFQRKIGNSSKTPTGSGIHRKLK